MQLFRLYAVDQNNELKDLKAPLKLRGTAALILSVCQYTSNTFYYTVHVVICSIIKIKILIIAALGQRCNNALFGGMT